MICPHCTHELEPQKMGSTVYWLCGSCNALWFDNKETDFLSLDEAKSLTELHNPAVLDHEKYLCVHCKKRLYKEPYFLHCYTCGGVLTSCELLVAEKQERAEELSKKRPFAFKDLRTVVILGVLGIFAVLNVTLLNKLSTKTTVTTQASDLKVQVQYVGKNKLAVFFSTEKQLRSTLVIRLRNGKVQTITMSDEPSYTHFAVIDKPENNEAEIILREVKNGVTQEATKQIRLIK